MALIPLLNAGSDGIKKMGDSAERFGLVMSEQMTKASEDFNDRLDDVQKSLLGFTLTIGAQFLPMGIRLFSMVTDIVVSMKDWVKVHPDLTKGIATLGAALLGSGGLLVGLATTLSILPKLSVAFTMLTSRSGLPLRRSVCSLRPCSPFRSSAASSPIR